MNRYEAISALAGSGKTYQLTLRFLALLSYGARPESILAITFTRKAAGEIFDRVLHRIAKALESEVELRNLEKDLRLIREERDYRLTDETLRGWLQAIIRAIPYLRIGTIDSLFISIVRAFAFELGIPPQCEVLEEGAEPVIQQEVLEAALSEAMSDKEASLALMSIFEDLTRGEKKAYWKELLNTINEAHALYLERPWPDLWGNAEKVWGNALPWWKSESARPDDIASLLDQLKTQLRPEGGNAAFEDAWNKVIQWLYDGTGDSKILAERLLEHLEDIRSGRPFDVNYYRKHYPLHPETVIALRRLIAEAISRIVESMQEKTRAAYNLVTHYERMYHARVRAKGMFSFADIQHILASARREVKLDIDYRLDGQFNHWMIDEFQDTSRWQWEVLENLADEILQSCSDERSFFYVGDPKQAIYGWRGGDTTLFDHVWQKYSAVFRHEPRVLNRSWRSSPAVLDVINKVFSPNTLKNVLAPWPRAIARWERHWVEHQTAEQNAELPGRVELHIIEGKNTKEQVAAVLRETCNVARMLKDRGVSSIAILVRQNLFGDEVAEYLRNNGLAVRREVTPKLLDNGTVSALLSLFHFADFPDDSFSFHHLVLSGLIPLLAQIYNLSAEELESNAPTARRLLADRLRADCSNHGIAYTLCRIVHTKGEISPSVDPFIAVRLRQLIIRAIAFDRLRRGSPADFAAYAAESLVTDPESASEIVVMTIHKAKGLEFDAVILPDLHRALNALRSGTLAVFDCDENKENTYDKTSGCIFPIPNKLVAKLDETLARFRAIQEEKRVYEELCLLYVAMTRARQELFMVIPAETSKNTIYPATVLQRILAPEHKKGEKCYMVARKGEWPSANTLDRQQEPEAPAVVPFSPIIQPRGDTQRRLIATTPSEEELVGTAPTAVSCLFDPQIQSALDRGALVHACFEKIEWYLPGLENRISPEWVSADAAYPPELVDAVIQEVAASLRDPTIQNLLKKPSENAEVWREQAFEMADGNRWITGRIDRVVVEKGSFGKIRSAFIVDFKTDRISSSEALEDRVDIYRPQLLLYKKAVSRLTELPIERVRAYLIFTHPHRCEEC